LKTANILYDQAAELLRRIYSWRLSGPPVLDPVAHFPASERFSAAWQPLRDEALCVADNLSAIPRFHEIMPQQVAISANDERDWRMFIVKAYGVTVPKNAAQCPVLAALVSSAPEVLSATLSFLAPGKRIPEHRGPFRGVIRYYLGLSVPLAPDGLPGTVLTVDGTEYRIGNGQWLLWDDTFAHEVRNDTENVRIALLLDVRRRGMPLDMEMLSRLLIAAAAAAVRLRRFA
jgi:aspartate beta-hydroxylase